MFYKILRTKNERYLTCQLLCRRQFSNRDQDSRQVDNGVLQVSDIENAISYDKSGLLEQHKNIIRNKKPYKEPTSWIHLTEKYQRKIFGRYGAESGVSSRICFGTHADNVSRKQFDDLSEAETVLSLISKYKAQEANNKLEVKKREEDITKKLEKLEQWKQELHTKIAKKEADALAAKEKRERLIEEVRRHFGYKVDPRDERFKEVLEQKEREDKKKQKEAKRKAKEEKMINKIAESTKSQKLQ